MATKLKRLVVDRVDLVDRGANPDAHIALFKRAREPDQNPALDGQRSGTMEKQDDGWISKMVRLIAKKLGVTEEDVAKEEPQSVADVLAHDKAMEEFWNLKWALSRSLETIMECDKTMEEKVSLMGVAVAQFAQMATTLTQTIQEGEDMAKVQAFLHDVSGAGSDVAKVHSIVKALEPPAKPPGDTSLVNPVVKKKDGEDPMKLDEFLKSLSPEQRAEAEAEIAKRAPAPVTVVPESVTKRLEELEKSAAKVEALEKRATDAETKLTKAETELAAEREHRTIAEFLAKADKYPTAGTPEHVSAKLRKAYSVSDEFGKEYETDLAKSEEMAKASKLFESIGKSGNFLADSAEAKIDNLAKARSVEQKITFEKAYDQVVEENRDLYKQMRAEQEGK